MGPRGDQESIDSSGNKKIVKDSVYSSTEFENKAGFSVTGAALNGEASSRIVGHAEMKHSDTSTVLGHEVTSEKSLSGHAEAGAKAGLHLGFDGLKAEGVAKAEATAAANASHEVKVGEGKAKIAGDVFIKPRPRPRRERTSRLIQRPERPRRRWVAARRLAPASAGTSKAA